MSRKDYVAFAKVLHDALRDPNIGPSARINIMDNIMSPMADIFEADNPLFDRYRFAAAVGYPQEAL